MHMWLEALSTGRAAGPHWPVLPCYGLHTNELAGVGGGLLHFLCRTGRGRLG